MANFTTLLYAVAAALFFSCVSANFYDDFDVTWGNDHAKILDNGRQIQLSLDKSSGSGLQSKKEYLFGKFDMKIKLVPGNSAGTVTTFYLSSQVSNHDEIDFEFLGNLSGDPYVLHTNIYSNGLGNREQQFYLWFDPTKGFHTYTIVWNPRQIIFLVDGTAIRVFPNSEDLGVPYPNKQTMRIYSSLWDGDDWATRGGLVKTDWDKAPFVASYRNFKVEVCKAKKNASSCFISSKQQWWNQVTQSLNSTQEKSIGWLQQNYMIYNYCTDAERFPQGFPEECTRQNLTSNGALAIDVSG